MQVRELIEQFRKLPNADIELSKLNGVTVWARGAHTVQTVFKAQQEKSGLWNARAKPGIIKATIKN